MGYNTQYSLEITLVPQQQKTPEEALEELLAENEEARYCLATDGTTNEGGKWYEHQPQLKAFSKRYPHLLFKLSGEGEEGDWYEHQSQLRVFSKRYPHLLFKLSGEGDESGDLWDKYFLDGKTQEAKAQIMKPPFNPDALK